MTKIAHFEITSPDPKSTAQFYKSVFGWRVKESEFLPNYYMFDLVDNEGGAVMDRSHQDQPTIIWFEVEDIDAVIDAIMKAGGRRINDKQTLPGVGQLIYVADPTGTVFGLKQRA